MALPQRSSEVPFRDKLLEVDGLLSQTWFWFFRSLYETLFPLGVESSFELNNNQSGAADVIGLKFNSRGTSQAIVEFLVQRVTTSTGATELIETGSFIVSYNPTAQDWNISLTNINSPDNSGVDFTITSSGQVQYTSSNITGTPQISRVVWRARVLAAKSAVYSSQGAR